MLTHAVEEKTSLKELEECIENAMSKIQAKRESKLCRYIPYEEGRLHHFAFNKLKKTNPLELRSMIQQHILDSEQPTMVPSKPRAALRVKRTAEITPTIRIQIAKKRGMLMSSSAAAARNSFCETLCCGPNFSSTSAAKAATEKMMPCVAWLRTTMPFRYL